MISLHVYLTPKPGREKDLADAICNKWLVAMSEQPGFLSAGLLEPFPDDELAKLGASTPETTYEVISLWQSEEERLAWVARPIHDEVFAGVIDASETVKYTLQTIKRSWNL